MGEAWTQWEGQVVNGIYPLRRFLNASDHSSVFLTETTTEGFLNAAIKLLPAEPAVVDFQLWHWRTAATFSHPHLMHLLDCGQCEIQGRQLLFVVMEYAEETLSQILPFRALAPDEVRELLVPTLDALAFLHRENWVQGQLKPANFLVVNDQLKLAVDTIRPVAVSREKVTRPTSYDAPEVERGETSVAADIWGLGVTLVEALTQYPPTWLHGRSEPPTLPTNLPLGFIDLVQRCLSINPADRPTVADLQVETKPTSVSPAAQQATPALSARPAALEPTPSPEPAMRATMPPHSYSASSRHSARAEWGTRNWAGAAIAALVVIFVAVWGGSRLFHRGAQGQTPPERVASNSARTPLPPAGPRSAAQGATSPPASSSPRSAATPPSAVSMPSASASPPRAVERQRASAQRGPAQADQRGGSEGARSASSSAAVVHEEIPKVPQSARQTIRGHVRVAVRVTVDKSGKVVRDRFENASSSNYFNRVASQAARKWRFASADSELSREWLLHFEFGRDGTTVHATRSRS